MHLPLYAIQSETQAWVNFSCLNPNNPGTKCQKKLQLIEMTIDPYFYSKLLISLLLRDWSLIADRIF